MTHNVDTLYYDGKCGLCNHEIKWLNRFKSEDLMLINIHSMDKAELSQLEPQKADLLTIMHLRKADRSWLTGLDATVKAWRHTSFGWLFTILRWPLIRTLADKLYYSWAEKRANRLGYCNL